MIRYSDRAVLALVGAETKNKGTARGVLGVSRCGQRSSYLLRANVHEGQTSL